MSLTLFDLSEMIFLNNFQLKLFCSTPAKILSNVKQFLATKSPLKMIKNIFYFTLKALLILKIFNFLSSIFVNAEKRLDSKDKVNFKVYDITAWLTNSCNTYIDQCLNKKR